LDIERKCSPCVEDVNGSIELDHWAVIITSMKKRCPDEVVLTYNRGQGVAIPCSCGIRKVSEVLDKGVKERVCTTKTSHRGCLAIRNVSVVWHPGDAFLVGVGRGCATVQAQKPFHIQTQWTFTD
jgi:hypothetical protein